MEIKEVIEKFAARTKNVIAELAEQKFLTGAEKKAKLDEKMTIWAEKQLEEAKMNVLLKQAVKQFVIKNIPVITQAVFNLIAAKIAGVTK